MSMCSTTLWTSRLDKHVAVAEGRTKPVSQQAWPASCSPGQLPHPPCTLQGSGLGGHEPASILLPHERPVVLVWGCRVQAAENHTHISELVKGKPPVDVPVREIM